MAQPGHAARWPRLMETMRPNPVRRRCVHPPLLELKVRRAAIVHGMTREGYSATVPVLLAYTHPWLGPIPALAADCASRDLQLRVYKAAPKRRLHAAILLDLGCLCGRGMLHPL
jgi:hypothetical protein